MWHKHVAFLSFTSLQARSSINANLIKVNTTASIALKLISEKLQSQPGFLCIDDTMVSKFGKTFENISTLFVYSAHNGSNDLSGHCFVSVMLCVPVWKKDKIHYLSVPLGYRMWQKKESKLELAASMIHHIMPIFHTKKNVIILCNSWYVKKGLFPLWMNMKTLIS